MFLIQFLGVYFFINILASSVHTATLRTSNACARVCVCVYIYIYARQVLHLLNNIAHTN